VPYNAEWLRNISSSPPASIESVLDNTDQDCEAEHLKLELSAWELSRMRCGSHSAARSRSLRSRASSATTSTVDETHMRFLSGARPEEPFADVLDRALAS
jgi:hypothetical protein